MKATREYSPPELIVQASVVTDRGCVRETNEDNGRHVMQRGAASNGKGTLTIVADGMGGHSSGEVASEMAIELISQYYYENRYMAMAEALRDSIERASADIYQTATSDRSLFGMGTTVVALAIDGHSGLAAHVGDSRLYRLRRGHMELLTLDHSQVMEMVKMGVISFEEAQEHEDKNIILRAVGTQPLIEVELSDSFLVEDGDEFLLCSDGLCDMATDQEIAEIWANAPDIHVAGERLVAFAKEKGGSDNITVGIVKAAADAAVARVVPATREIEV